MGWMQPIELAARVQHSGQGVKEGVPRAAGASVKQQRGASKCSWAARERGLSSWLGASGQPGHASRGQQHGWASLATQQGAAASLAPPAGASGVPGYASSEQWPSRMTSSKSSSSTSPVAYCTLQAEGGTGNVRSEQNAKRKRKE